MTEPLNPTGTEGTLEESSGSLSAISVQEVIIPQMDIGELTQVKEDGTGVLDVLIRNLKLNLDHEWEQERITGPEYARAFIELYQSTLQIGLGYVTARSRLGYEITNLQNDAKYKEAQIEIAKAQLEKIPHEINILKSQDAQIIAETLLTGTRNQLETANLAKVPVEVELLRKESLKADAQITLVTKQVEQITAEITKIPVELEILNKQSEAATAGIAQTEAQTERLVQETLNKLPVEIANLNKQGLQLVAETTLTTHQSALAEIQATKIPTEIELLQAEIASKAKQNLILEREYELKVGELDLQAKNLQLAAAELDLRREELKVKASQVKAQDAQADLYQQKVITEKAQVDSSVVNANSVIDLSNQVLKAQVKGYAYDAQNRLAKLMVDVFSVTYQNGDRDVNSTNKLTDVEMGKVMNKMFSELGVS